MRDIDLLARTMHAIRDKGGGIATRQHPNPARIGWKASDAVLNLQATHDLIAEGWLYVTTDARTPTSRHGRASRTRTPPEGPPRPHRADRTVPTRHARVFSHSETDDGQLLPTGSRAFSMSALRKMLHVPRRVRRRGLPPRRRIARVRDGGGSRKRPRRTLDLQRRVRRARARHPLRPALRRGAQSKRLVGLRLGLSCSKPRLEAFGGGAQLLDLGRRESIDYIDCTHWLELRLAPDGACDAAPLQEASP